MGMAESNLDLILDILSYKRPHGSVSIDEFIARFFSGDSRFHADRFGNIFMRVGSTSRTMFSCHLDTVHAYSGRQKVTYDAYSGFIELAEDSCCLGADNGAGIWLMLNMIKRDIPGLYIFHQDEENSRGGSKWIRDNQSELLDDIDRAIAFDRKGSGEVITHMFDERCCSELFAKSLACQLGDDFHTARGLSTDTRTYRYLVPECTNVSIGYHDCHRPSEMLDYNYLCDLLERVQGVNFEELPTVRSLVQENIIVKNRYSKLSAQDEWDLFMKVLQDGVMNDDKKLRMELILTRLVDSGNPHAIDAADEITIQLETQAEWFQIV